MTIRHEIARRRLQIRCLILPAAMVAVTMVVVGYAVAPPAEIPAPRLVGYNCEGAAGPLYAVEESEFPRCAAIEEMK